VSKVASVRVWKRTVHTNLLGFCEQNINVLVRAVITGHTRDTSSCIRVEHHIVRSSLGKTLPDMMFFDSLKGAQLYICIDDTRTDLFEPMLTIALEGGPMKTMPSSASRSANFAFSLKNP